MYYVRSGVTSSFAAFDIADDTVISALHRRHRAVEFKRFLVAIDKTVPIELDVHIVCDNLATHKTVTVRTGWRNIHGSISISPRPGYLTDQLLRRGVHTSVASLKKDMREWIADWNENPKPFAWTRRARSSIRSQIY